MVPPTPGRVARRAVILYTLMMRYTAETNATHPRAQEWLAIFPQWLDELEMGSEVEPIDAAILAAPLGALEPEQQTDARWSGEAVGILGWCLQRVGPPADFDAVDPNAVFAALGLEPATLVEGAKDLIARAALRPKEELLAYYAKLKTVQCCMRCRSLNEKSATPILQQITRQELADLDVPKVDFTVSEESVSRISDEQFRALIGNYFVRVHATGWVIGERECYWGEDEEGEEM